MRALLVAAVLAIPPTGGFAQAPGTPATPADSALAARVMSAIEAASDIPADSLSVVATDGRIDVVGSVVCDDCGGNSTPGGAGTVQQSLGAVVRAVPGVAEVRFDLRYRRPEGR